jgi:hypothetical protein
MQSHLLLCCVASFYVLFQVFTSVAKCFRRGPSGYFVRKLFSSWPKWLLRAPIVYVVAQVVTSCANCFRRGPSGYFVRQVFSSWPKWLLRAPSVYLVRQVFTLCAKCLRCALSVYLCAKCLRCAPSVYGVRQVLTACAKCLHRAPSVYFVRQVFTLCAKCLPCAPSVFFMAQVFMSCAIKCWRDISRNLIQLRCSFLKSRVKSAVYSRDSQTVLPRICSWIEVFRHWS